MTNYKIGLTHFYFHRVIEYLKFYPHYIFCKLFHRQDNQWQSYKGAIVCNCGYVCDLGYSYGQHCEGCYNFCTERVEKRVR